jgi:DNA-binding GntR family transcriptional regulator
VGGYDHPAGSGRDLVAEIESGRRAQGDRLPSIVDLAETYFMRREADTV